VRQWNNFLITSYNLSLFLELIEPKAPLFAHGCWEALYKYSNTVQFSVVVHEPRQNLQSGPRVSKGWDRCITNPSAWKSGRNNEFFATFEGSEFPGLKRESESGIDIIPRGRDVECMWDHKMFCIVAQQKKTLALGQWCTTFFGRGPLIDFLIPSGAKQVWRYSLCQMHACQNVWRWYSQ